ncbi:hypothetical protein WN51_06302 [Melipona quadrifasciata]|uniref:Uncharacterized protein n=1 Tax=Melipona quadrifasciata TaxID=166423 RepID=A0A0M8ZTD8_9HYME|nr:hypothetical protein WN51_06302 [Melipona quadrifasciata]
MNSPVKEGISVVPEFCEIGWEIWQIKFFFSASVSANLSNEKRSMKNVSCQNAIANSDLSIVKEISHVYISSFFPLETTKSFIESDFHPPHINIQSMHLQSAHQHTVHSSTYSPHINIQSIHQHTVHASAYSPCIYSPHINLQSAHQHTYREDSTNKKRFPAAGISIVDGLSEISNEKHMAKGRDYLFGAFSVLELENLASSDTTKSQNSHTFKFPLSPKRNYISVLLRRGRCNVDFWKGEVSSTKGDEPPRDDLKLLPRATKVFEIINLAPEEGQQSFCIHWSSQRICKEHDLENLSFTHKFISDLGQDAKIESLITNYKLMLLAVSVEISKSPDRERLASAPPWTLLRENSEAKCPMGVCFDAYVNVEGWPPSGKGREPKILFN